MALDLNVRALLDQMKALALPKVWELAPAAARAAMKSRILSGKETPSGPIRNLTIPGPANDIALRSYTPLGAKDAMLPGLVFFHGGGFVLGDLDTHDDLCRHIANGSGCRVVSVDYRLAPEHPFPAARRGLLRRDEMGGGAYGRSRHRAGRLPSAATARVAISRRWSRNSPRRKVPRSRSSFSSIR